METKDNPTDSETLEGYYRLYLALPEGVKKFTNENVRMVLGTAEDGNISRRQFEAWWNYQWVYPIDGRCWADRFRSWQNHK